MKLTLLELVQDILTAIDAENVSDIGETEEAGMAVNILNRSFEKIATAKRWRHFKEHSVLSTTTALNEMVTPSGTIAFSPDDMYYEGNRVFYRTPEDFLNLTIKREISEDNIVLSNRIKVFNDRVPTWFTSFDDETVVFDAYPTASGLVSADTDCLCFILPTSRLTLGTQVFDLPQTLFPALSLYATAVALRELKGDSTTASTTMRDYRVQMNAAARNGRLIDRKNDLRKWIVPRRVRRMIINTGTGFIHAG